MGNEKRLQNQEYWLPRVRNSQVRHLEMNRKVNGNGSGNMEGNLGVIRRNRISYFGSFFCLERVWSTSCLFFCGVVLVSSHVYVLRLRTNVFPGGTLFGIFLAKVDGSLVWPI
jgi:hypothetical protein